MIHRTFTIRMILYIALVVVGGVLLYTKFQLGLVRYFDIDEMTHIHWSHNFFAGLRPYTDFLYFIPPVFLAALTPLFWFAGVSTKILLYSRIFAFVIFLFLLIFLFLVTAKLRNKLTGLLAVVIVLFLPIPADKLLEVRPDTLSVVCALAGIYFLLKSYDNKGWNLFLSGFAYSLAIAVSPKTFFFLPGACLVLLWMYVKKYMKGDQMIQFISGGLLPFSYVMFIFFRSGNISRAFYLTLGFANTASKVLGAKFFMLPNLFFYPNDVYYGLGGLSVPYILNLLIYITACLFAIYRAISFYNHSGDKKRIGEMLVALSFFANLYAFVKLFPLKHVQYLIALAPFIAFYFADFIDAVGNKIHAGFTSPNLYFSFGMRFFRLFSSGSSDPLPSVHELLSARLQMKRSSKFIPRFNSKSFSHTTHIIYQIIIILFVIYLGWLGWKTYQIKRFWTNASTYNELSTILQTVPKDEYILDLIGTTTFYKDPYYICCLPYGQYEEAFAITLPSLSQALKRTQTKYIFVQHAGRISILPSQEAKFISDHYIDSGNGPFLLVAGKKMVFDQVHRSEPIDIVTDGYYQIVWNKEVVAPTLLPQLLSVDDTIVKENPIYLNQGSHTVQAQKSGEMIIRFVYKKM